MDAHEDGELEPYCIGFGLIMALLLWARWMSGPKGGGAALRVVLWTAHPIGDRPLHHLPPLPSVVRDFLGPTLPVVRRAM